MASGTCVGRLDFLNTTNRRGYKRILPCLENSLASCVRKNTQACQPRGTGEPGKRIDAASTVKGTSAAAETISEACLPNSEAVFPQNSEPPTLSPKTTIW